MIAIKKWARMTSRLNVVACLILSAACGNASSPAASQSYVLVSVNGQLPATISQHPGNMIVITSGNITLDPEGRFVSTAMLRVTRGGATNDSTLLSQGSYRFVGQRLELRNDGGETASLTRADGALEYISLGKQFRYVRTASDS